MNEDYVYFLWNKESECRVAGLADKGEVKLSHLEALFKKDHPDFYLSWLFFKEKKVGNHGEKNKSWAESLHKRDLAYQWMALEVKETV